MLWSPREGGQGLVEYALIILLVAVIIVVLIAVMGVSVSGLYSKIVELWPG